MSPLQSWDAKRKYDILHFVGRDEEIEDTVTGLRDPSAEGCADGDLPGQTVRST